MAKQPIKVTGVLRDSGGKETNITYDTRGTKEFTDWLHEKNISAAKAIGGQPAKES